MAVLTVDQVLSGAALGLTSGLSDILVLEIGGRRVLYALSRIENRLIELEIAADGSLSVVGSLNLQGIFPAGSEPLLGQVTTANGDTRLTLAGLPVADGQSVSLSSTGALGNQSSLASVGVLSAPAEFDLGGTAALVSAASGGGLNLYTDNGSGFGWSAGLNDSTDRYLADVAASVAFEDGGAKFVATVSFSEDGVNIAAVTSAAFTQSGALGAIDGLPVDQPSTLMLCNGWARRCW